MEEEIERLTNGNCIHFEEKSFIYLQQIKKKETFFYSIQLQIHKKTKEKRFFFCIQPNDQRKEQLHTLPFLCNIQEENGSGEFTKEFLSKYIQSLSIEKSFAKINEIISSLPKEYWISLRKINELLKKYQSITNTQDEFDEMNRYISEFSYPKKYYCQYLSLYYKERIKEINYQRRKQKCERFHSLIPRLQSDNILSQEEVLSFNKILQTYINDDKKK